MLRKILILFICFSIILCLALPANAEINYSDTRPVVDLLSAKNYSILCKGSSLGPYDDFSFSSTSVYPYFEPFSIGDDLVVDFSDCSFFSIKWNPLIQSFTSNIYIYLNANLANVSFYVNGKKVVGNWTGSGTNAFAGYNVVFASTLVKEIEVRFERDSNFTASPALLSAFCFPVYEGQITSGDIIVDNIIADYNEDLDVWTLSYDRILDAPMQVKSDKDYPYFNPYLAYENYWITDFHEVRQSRIHLIFDLYSSTLSDSLDYVTLNFASIGDAEHLSAFVSSEFDEWANIGTAIDCDLFYADFAAAGLKNPYIEYEANGYTAICDLQGVNIRDSRYLHIELVVDPLNADAEYSTYSYFELFTVEYSFDVCTDLTKTFVLSYIETLLAGFTVFYSDYINNSQLILAALEDLNNSLNATSDQQQEIDQGKQQMQNQAGELSDLNNVMGAVEKPNVDFSDAAVDVGGTILPNNYLSYIVNEPHVYAILGTVCLLMVISFIFFGKKR